MLADVRKSLTGVQSALHRGMEGGSQLPGVQVGLEHRCRGQWTGVEVGLWLSKGEDGL
jgi:hypothetical protein